MNLVRNYNVKIDYTARQKPHSVLQPSTILHRLTLINELRNPWERTVTQEDCMQKTEEISYYCKMDTRKCLKKSPLSVGIWHGSLKAKLAFDGTINTWWDTTVTVVLIRAGVGLPRGT